MDTVRSIIVGFGSIAQNVHVPLIESTDGIELVGVVSQHPDRVHAVMPELPAVTTLHTAFQTLDPELVIVTTPNATHHDIAKTALELGGNVLVEKPFVVDTGEMMDLLEVAHRVDRMVSVFQNRQFDSDFLAIADLKASNALGDIKTVMSNYDRYRPNVRDRWREDGAPGSGLWYDLGPHLVDQAVRLFGRPDAVVGDLAIQRKGSRSDDWFNVTLKYGVRRVILHADSFEAGGSDRWIVRGTTHSAYKHQLDQQEQQLHGGLRPGQDGWGVDPDPVVLIDGATGERQEMEAPRGRSEQFYSKLVRAIRFGETPPVTEEELKLVMEILDAGRSSAASGQAVALP